MQPPLWYFKVEPDKKPYIYCQQKRLAKEGVEFGEVLSVGQKLTSGKEAISVSLL